MRDVIEVNAITKYYDDLLALDQISFGISPGEIFGLLGPNGAGKTTTIKILTGLARPSSGGASVNAVDVCQHPKQAQQYMGIVPEESNLYPELSGFDNLAFCGALYGMSKKARCERARALLSQFNLAEAADRKFLTYSKGMKRKLTLAAGLIHNPPVLFLDEPTTGIDLNSARQIRQLILDLRKSGVTILLTTHYIEEAERLCDRIGFLVKGQLIKVERLSTLLQPMQNLHILELSLSALEDGLIQKVQDHLPDFQVDLLPGVRLRLSAGQPIPVSAVINFIEESGVEVREARRIKPSLEEVFIMVTGLGKREMMNTIEDQS